MASQPSPDWTRVCPQSPLHRTLPNGTIEIQDEGVPEATVNYWGDATYLPQVHATWGAKLAAAAAKWSVPYPWVLAIATVEGGWQHPDRLNSAGAGGVMALMPVAFKAMRGYTPSSAEMLDPDTNIDVGVALLASLKAKYGELPAVAASYNAGSPRCSSSTQCKSTIDGGWNSDGTSAENSWGMVEDCTQGHGTAYARRAVALSNSAILMGLTGGSGAGGKAFALLALGAASFLAARRSGTARRLASRLARHRRR